jgi:hypothetical protein
LDYWRYQLAQRYRFNLTEGLPLQAKRNSGLRIFAPKGSVTQRSATLLIRESRIQDMPNDSLITRSFWPAPPVETEGINGGRAKQFASL